MTRRIMQLKRASARTRASAFGAGRRNHRASLPIAAGAALAMLIAVMQAAPTQAAPATRARALPDLTVSAVSDSPSAIVVGTPFTITATTTNAGKRPAPVSVTRFYVSTDAVLGPSDVALSGELAVGKLKKHHSRTASVALTLGALPAAGTYSLLACADDTKLVAEADEADNCRASAGTVSFGPPPDPDPDPDPPPDPDPDPSPDPDPPPSGDSSQALIQADLDAGLIDYGTSLIYRAWTLFWDARLPARYDGAGSTGEDLSLFPEIEAALPSLPAEQQAELQGWISRPTDPLSQFGTAAITSETRGATAADTSVKCTAPNAWFHLDHPQDNTNTGFRAWMCAASSNEAADVLNPLLTNLTGIAQLFTQPEPAGMGRPVPDTLSTRDNGGNGKIDVYVLATNQCRDRNGECVNITGTAPAATVPDGNIIGQTPGFPPRSTTAYILISLANAGNVRLLAHEFFHVLQFAHSVAGMAGTSGNRDSSWYYDASADWATWHPNLRHLSKNYLYGTFRRFQDTNSSLLEYSDVTKHQYQSWIWPLFQELKAGGATSVYRTWATAELAEDVAGVDAAVNSQLRFADSFRDFSVRNLQADDYVTGIDTGLESDSWQSFIDDFPDKSHVTSSRAIGLDQYSAFAHVKVLAAQNDRFEITDPRVRQVTIDLSPLQNAGSAKLDIVGQIGPLAALTEPHRWRRIRADSSTYTFCRDFPDEDFSLFYIVLSNHSSTRIPKDGPDPAAAVSGSYNVEAQDHCDIPIAYKGTFKVTETCCIKRSAVGNVTFKYASTEAECGSFVPPTPDNLHYCYYLDSAEETWTAPSYTTGDPPCTYFPRDAQFSYANDEGRHGGIDITRRSPDPSYSDIYSVWFGSNTKTMVIDSTCEDSRTIGLSFYSIISSGCFNSTPPARFTGWALKGSCTYEDPGGVTVWSWDLSPVFEE